MSNSLEHQPMNGCSVISGMDVEIFQSYLTAIQTYPPDSAESKMSFHEWKAMKWEELSKIIKPMPGMRRKPAKSDLKGKRIR